MEPSRQTPDASALVHGPVDSSKPKGCGRADCCQLDGDKKVETTAPNAAFPQFEFKPYRPSTELIFPPGLRKHPLKPLKFGSSTKYSKTWYRPVTLDQLVALKRAIPDAKLVGGASEVAIEVGIKGSAYPACIYVSDIPELAGVSLPDFDSPAPALEFGANLSLSDLERVVRKLIDQAPAAQTGALKAVRDQLRYFAGRQIRNAASTGGNIATASPISDLNPVWAATGAKVVCVAPASRPNDGEFELAMDDFFTGYRQTKLPQDGIILRVVLPIPPKRLEEQEKVEVVRAYKQAKRRDDDIAIVTACLRAKVDVREKKFEEVKIAFGGMA